MGKIGAELPKLSQK